MLYSAIVKNEIRKTFNHVNNHRWDEAVKAVAPHVHHRVSGAHALGGERHDKKAMRRWFERNAYTLRAVTFAGPAVA